MKPIKVLLFSSLFPSSVRPIHGIFVETRLRELVRAILIAYRDADAEHEGKVGRSGRRDPAVGALGAQRVPAFH